MDYKIQMFSLCTLRTVVHWLVLASLLASPYGAGASIAPAAGAACETVCPCDSVDIQTSDSVAESCGNEPCCTGAEHSSSQGNHSGAGACADGCTECDCCPSVMPGVMFSFTALSFAPAHPVMMRIWADVPIRGVFSGTFRPPKSFT